MASLNKCFLQEHLHIYFSCRKKWTPTLQREKALPSIHSSNQALLLNIDIKMVIGAQFTDRSTSWSSSWLFIWEMTLVCRAFGRSGDKARTGDWWMLSTSVYVPDGLEMLPLHEAAREGVTSRESFFDEVMLSMLWNRGTEYESAGECDESNPLTAGTILATTEERSPPLEVSWVLFVAFSAISELAVNVVGTKKLAPLIGLKDCVAGAKNEPELVTVSPLLLNVSTYLEEKVQMIPVRNSWILCRNY